MNVTARVHSIHYGPAVVNSFLADGTPVQGHVQGMTVELIDANGGCHSHVFVGDQLEDAKATFGSGEGAAITVSYALETAAPEREPHPDAEAIAAAKAEREGVENPVVAAAETAPIAVAEPAAIEPAAPAEGA